MPIQTAPKTSPGAVQAIVPAPGGHTAQLAGGPPTVTGTAPVVAWALIADATIAGSMRIDPVLLFDGRAWTPDQLRASYGPRITVTVA